MTKASDTANILSQPFTNTLGTSNYRAGVNAGDSIASGGAKQVLVGDGAGTALTTGENNVAIGFDALKTEDAHGLNVAVGFEALKTLNAGADAYNTAVGFSAGENVTTGLKNVLIGALAGDALTDADFNVAVGHLALSADTLGSKSVAIGEEALAAQNFTTATDSNNTAVGYKAGNAVTTGARNTIVGSLGAEELTTADDSVGIGYLCLGGNAGAATTGHDNVCVGSYSGSALTTGGQNVYIGQQAAYNATEGGANVCIGFKAGAVTTLLGTGGTNTLIGSYTHSSTTDAASSVGLGHSLSCATGYATIGHGGQDIRAAHGNTTWSTVSDERYKKDIVDSTAGLGFINDLRPRTFKYKNLGDLPNTFNSYEEGSTEVFKNANTNHGFIAQEVKTAINAHSEIKDGFRLWDNRDDGSQEIAEAALIPVLVKALQELSAKNDALETSLTSALARIKALEDA